MNKNEDVFGDMRRRWVAGIKPPRYRGTTAHDYAPRLEEIEANKLPPMTEVLGWIVGGFLLIHLVIGAGSLLFHAIGEKGILYLPFWHDPYLYVLKLLA